MSDIPPLSTRTNRYLELLAYSVVCFRHGTTPFEHTHLQKKNVTAAECIDLCGIIADILEDELDTKALHQAFNAMGKEKVMLGKNWIEEAEKDFKETQ